MCLPATITSGRPCNFGIDSAVVAAAMNFAAFASLKAVSNFETDPETELNVRWLWDLFAMFCMQCLCS